MNSVRVLNRSVFAAIILVTTCYGLQDLRLASKMPRSSYIGLADGRIGAIIFPGSINAPILDDPSRNLVDFKNEIQLNGYPQRTYYNDQEIDLHAEKDIFPEILQNHNAVEKLPYVYNNLNDIHDKVTDAIQKYSDNDFTKRVDTNDETERGSYDPRELGPGHGKETSAPPKNKDLPDLFNEYHSDQDKKPGLALVYW